MRGSKSKMVVVILVACTSSIVWASPTDTFEITAEIEAGCLVNGAIPIAGSTIGNIGLIDFGEASAISSLELTAQLTLANGFSLTCTPGVEVTMQVSEGNNFDAGTRFLAHTDNSANGGIAYKLFADSQLSTELAANSPMALLRNSVENVNITMHGQIILTGNHEVGSYSDELVLTLEW